LLQKDRAVLTDDPTRAGEPGYVGRTEKADIVRLSVERAPAVKPDICDSGLTGKARAARLSHEQIGSIRRATAPMHSAVAKRPSRFDR
jgi:hypothetical protein